MRHKLIASTAIVLALTAPAFAWEPSAMRHQIEQTNFLLNNDCSATLIDKEHGYLLTANHCIADQFQIITKQSIDDKGVVKSEQVRIAVPGHVDQLKYSGVNVTERLTYNVKIKAADEGKDLALLQTLGPLPNTEAAPISCNDPEQGDTVYAVGNPFVVLYNTVGRGIVSSTQRDYQSLGLTQGDETPDLNGDNGLIQHTATMAPGNSGGALYNDKGELVGVNVRGVQVAALYFAVPLSDVKAFLADNGISDKCNAKQ